MKSFCPNYLLIAAFTVSLAVGCGKKSPESPPPAPDAPRTVAPAEGSGQPAAASSTESAVEAASSQGSALPEAVRDAIDGAAEEIVVATVNGTDVVFDVAGYKSRRAASPESSPTPEEAISQTVDYELMHQAALAMGMDKTEKHTKLTTRFERLAELEGARMLARLYEDHDLKDRSLSVPEVADSDVEAYYEEHKREYGNLPKDAVLNDIRLRLLKQARDDARSRWAATLVDRAKVTLAGAAVPTDSLRKALHDTSATNAPEFYESVVAVVRAKGLREKDYHAVTEFYRELTMEVGPYKLPLALLGMGNFAPGEAFWNEASLKIARHLRPYMVAAVALQSEVKDHPDWIRAKAHLAKTTAQQLRGRLIEAYVESEILAPLGVGATPTQRDAAMAFAAKELRDKATITMFPNR